MKVSKKLFSVCLALTLVATTMAAPTFLKAKAADTQITNGSSVGVVTVEGGKVKGVAADESGNGVQVFKGVPFAASTAGSNQWKAPQPVKSWSGIKVCDTWGDSAMQPQQTDEFPLGSFFANEFYYNRAFTPKTSDSGLNLNVWTSAKTRSAKLPVLVWIHGGGNAAGNGSEMEFYPTKLVKKGVIVVDLQYRLGAFGFLATKEMASENKNGSAGNFAVLDLVKGLKWVKNYIAGFGGDPNKVTIAGQSAGAMNVTALLRTPLSKGLFKGAIIQSGFYGLLTAKGVAAYKTLAEQDAANKVTIKAAFGKEMSLSELRTLPSDYYITHKVNNNTLFSALSNSYTIDGYVFTNKSVDLTRNGVLNGLNIMIGGASDEFTSLFGDPNGTMDLNSYAAAMKSTYGLNFAKGYATPSNTTVAYRTNMRSMSDSSFQKYVLSAEYVKAHNKNLNVYTYYLSHSLPGRNSSFYGAFHSSDLWCFFNSMRNQEGQRTWKNSDYNLATIMSSYYANFIKTGSPNGQGLTTWKQCASTTNASFINFGDGIAKSATATAYPERDALNRAVNMKSFGLTDDDLLIK